MGAKAGLLFGFGAGYVLGSRAGRERYRQIRELWAQMSGSPKLQRAAERTKAVAGDSAKRSFSAVQRGVEKAGTSIKDRLQKDQGEGALRSWDDTPVVIPEATPAGSDTTLEAMPPTIDVPEASLDVTGTVSDVGTPSIEMPEAVDPSEPELELPERPS